jgi:hypothetical protein
MRVDDGGGKATRSQSIPLAPGPLRVKALNDTIATLEARNAQLRAVHEQCITAMLALHKNALCIVCLDVLYEPLLLICPKQCMQNMCSACFVKTDRRCPTCKEPTLTTISCGYAIHSLLGCVPRECDDCRILIYPTEQQSTLQRCGIHRTVCPDARLDCSNKPHGCVVTYKRKDREMHLQSMCAHVPCANFIGWYDGRPFGCLFRGTARVTAEHERTCALERDTHFLFHRLAQQITSDSPPLTSAYEPVESCKNVERLIDLLRNEHRACL